MSLADLTCLHHPDVSVAGVDHGLLEEVSGPVAVRGAGGSAEYRVVTSDVVLDDSCVGALFHHMPRLIAAESQAGRLERPSFLVRAADGVLWSSTWSGGFGAVCGGGQV